MQLRVVVRGKAQGSSGSLPVLFPLLAFHEHQPTQLSCLSLLLSLFPQLAGFDFVPLPFPLSPPGRQAHLSHSAPLSFRPAFLVTQVGCCLVSRVAPSRGHTHAAMVSLRISSAPLSRGHREATGKTREDGEGEVPVSTSPPPPPPPLASSMRLPPFPFSLVLHGTSVPLYHDDVHRQRRKAFCFSFVCSPETPQCLSTSRE